MDERISTLKDAHQRYINALKAVMAEFNAAVDHRNNDLAMKSSIQNLNEQHGHYLLASKDLRDFVDMRLRELEVAHRNIATAVSQALGDMESDTRNRDEADVPEQQKVAVSQALVDLDLNRPEPEKTAEDRQDTLEHKMAASQILPDLDPNKKA